jgi:NAD(P)-dependent dehydrogenase (short-subunit alcohol dehydrogenase family)
VVNVHFKGVYFLTQKLLPLMNDGGRIVNISSGLTRVSVPGSSAYAAAKGAIEVLTRYLAKELGTRGVTVNSILPTVIAGAGLSTDDVRPQAREFIQAFNPMRRPGTVQDVADAAEYLASDLSAFVSGQQLKLSGGGPA